MIRSSRLVIPLLGALALTGCSANLSDYRDETPVLKLSEFFSGQLEAKGIVQDFRGRVVRRFSADIVGQWNEEGRGVLDEHFVYEDGSEQSRCWRLTEDGQDYAGTAGDVVGDASGRAEGNAFNWQYRLKVPVSGDEWELSMDDWMFLVDEDALINRTRISKWRIPVGEITLYIRKVHGEPDRPLSGSCLL